MSVFLSLSAALLALLSLLNVFKAPTLTTWKLSILTSEWGHAFALAALLILSITTMRAWLGHWKISILFSMTCAGVASALFLRPFIEASRVAAALPARLSSTFGDFAPAYSPLLWFAASPHAEAPLLETSATYDTPLDGPPLALDVITPQDRSVKRPVVVMIHGGGWDSGSRNELKDFSRKIARLGYAVVAPDYSLAPKARWPRQRDDILKALAYLSKNGPEWNLDTQQIILCGRSAGGQIAESVAYSRKARTVKGVIALYAPADLLFAWKNTPERDVLDSKKLIRQYLGGSPEETPDAFRDASPYLAAEHTDVPTLLIHGRIDPLVWHRQSERLSESLARNSPRSFFLDLPCATHGFDFNASGPSAQLTLYTIDWFLASLTHPAAPAL